MQTIWYPLSLRISGRMVFILAFFCIWFFAPSVSSAQQQADSLRKIISSSKDRNEICRAKLKLIDVYFRGGDQKTAETLNNSLLRDAHRMSDDSLIAATWHNKTNFLFQRSEIDSAKIYIDSMLKWSVRVHDKTKFIQALNNNGSYYFFADNYKQALVYYDSALRVEARYGFKEGTYASLNNIGIIYLETKIPEMAIRYFRKSAARTKGLSKNSSLIHSYDCMSDAFMMMNKYDSSIYYASLSLKIATMNHIPLEMGTSHCSIGNAYKAMKKYDSAIVHYNMAQEINKRVGDSYLSYTSSAGLAETYFKQNRIEEAEKVAERLRSLMEENTITSEDRQLGQLFASLEYKKKNYKKAFDYLNDYMNYRDSCYNLEISSQISEINTKYETEKKEKENQLLQAQNELSQSSIRQQRTVILFAVGGLLITLVLLYFIFRGLKNQKEANKIISEQKHLVEEKQKEILDSIHYAKRIQNTLLAHADFVNEYIPANFILFKPKDIVSGDFYWATKRNNLFYLAVCDSTGHGVPGAFMSLLNIGFLNEAITEKGISEPDKIFNHVRERLENSISKEGQKDGFDGILLCIDLLTRKISYAAANNAPVIVSNGEAVYGECDKMPVGKGERTNSFTLRHLQALPGDMLYLYTDGFADQFGGPKGKKFMYKQLNSLLAQVSAQALEDQKDRLNHRFEEWKDMLEQVDDVCVIGIRL